MTALDFIAAMRRPALVTNGSLIELGMPERAPAAMGRMGVPLLSWNICSHKMGIQLKACIPTHSALMVRM